MKNSFLLFSALTALLLTGSTLAADGPTFPRDQIQGKVRCVLMSVGQTTVFPNDKPGEPVRRDQQGVPCLTVTYLVERLGEEPFRAAALQEMEVSAGGKSVKLANSHNGTYTKFFDYKGFPSFVDFTKPSVSNPARAVVIQHVEFGAVPNLRPFDLPIKAGFDEDVPTLRFPSIKLQ